jgi:hypothetical protein
MLVREVSAEVVHGTAACLPPGTNLQFFIAFSTRGDKAGCVSFVVTLSEEEFVMRHLCRFAPLFVLAILLSNGQRASAQLYFDDFEIYNLGALDFNLVGGPNQGTNGDLNGNPWFGPAPPNCLVVVAEFGIDPHSGQQMIRGLLAGNDIDQNWFNLAYRLNNGLPFAENVVLDWWFYDPLGPCGTDFKDYIALAFYDTAPSNTDAPPDFDLNNGFTKIQRLSLGAPGPTSDPMFDANYYQARVAGATDGFGAGYFNTQTNRSVGWHHAAIVVGPMLNDGTNDLAYYIDDMDNPTFMHNSVTNFGYNVIEINASFGAKTGYFDDITFDTLSPGN